MIKFVGELLKEVAHDALSTLVRRVVASLVVISSVAACLGLAVPLGMGVAFKLWPLLLGGLWVGVFALRPDPREAWAGAIGLVGGGMALLVSLVAPEVDLASLAVGAFSAFIPYIGGAGVAPEVIEGPRRRKRRKPAPAPDRRVGTGRRRDSFEWERTGTMRQ